MNKYKSKTYVKYDPTQSLARQILQAQGRQDLWQTYQSEYDKYLNDGFSLEDFSDPFSLKDMDKAVATLLPILDQKKKILVYGDYDCDGVTATAIMCNFFEHLEQPYLYYLPDRLNEGYGLGKAGVAYAKEENCACLLTVDCGVHSVEEARLLENAGIRCIITDHHECPDVLPPASAVIDPKRPDETAPYLRILCGAGLALKLCQALSQKLGKNNLWKVGLGLAAIGTLGDIMNLEAENRLIVLAGLKQINTEPPIGIQALMSATKLSKGLINAKSISYRFVSAINAAGRIASPTLAAKLLLAQDPDEARTLATQLLEINEERKALQNAALEEAMSLILKDFSILKREIIVLASDKWHRGIIGILAATLSKKFHKPSVILTTELGSDVYHGSARNYNSIDILTCLQTATEHLTALGGHQAAAGLELPVSNLADFISTLAELQAPLPLATEEDIDELYIELPPSALSLTNAKNLEVLEPFGKANPEPIVVLNELATWNAQSLGADNSHLKITMEDNDCNILAFGQADILPKLKGETKPLLNIEGELSVNTFRGKENPQLIASSIIIKQEASSQLLDKLLKLEKSFPTWNYWQLALPLGLPSDSLCLHKEDLKIIYLELMGLGLGSSPLVLSPELQWKLASTLRRSNTAIAMFLVKICLEIYVEASLLDCVSLEKTENFELCCYNLIPSKETRKLALSVRYQAFVTD